MRAFGVGTAALGAVSLGTFASTGSASESEENSSATSEEDKKSPASAQSAAGDGSLADTIPDETHVTLDGELVDVQDNVEYALADGAEEPDYGARITHVFGANALMDYYLFDGFTGIGIDEKNDTMAVRDLIMSPSGGTFENIRLKDKGSGDERSLIRDVRTLTYVTPDGAEVNIKCQTLHGANPAFDGMVVYTSNKPGALNRSLKVPLSCFDGHLTRRMNYILGNPDSGKHNTESKEVDGMDETSISFHFNEDDPVQPGLQHVYTKYAHNGEQNYWLYIESANRFDVRTDALGSGVRGTREYIEGTSLNMSVREPADGAHHVIARIDRANPDRLLVSVPIDDVFYFDPDEHNAVQNAELTDEREFAFWRAEVGQTNEALQGKASLSCDLQTPGTLCVSIQCDRVVAGELDLDVSVSAGRGTGWATEWSETPATIRVQVTE
jgi:hypothetical protein